MAIVTAKAALDMRKWSSPDLIIEPYSSKWQTLWNQLERASRNGTFLLEREFMEYHQDRFEDASLLVFSEKGAPLALFPANRQGAEIVSHGGLTYGGLIYGNDVRTPELLETFDALLTHLCQNGYKKLIYKTIPHIYHTVPAEEDRYALFLAGAQLTRRDVLAVVDQAHRLPYQTRRLRSIAKARSAGVTCSESNDFKTFWDLLHEVLMARYGVPPVHSLEEILLLKSSFPTNIRLFTASSGDYPVAGVTIFESSNVAHLQYIAANEEGRACGALDLLFDFLLNEIFKEKRYFDFGISNENSGRYLNHGLIDQKEGFGARAVAHDFYELDLLTWEPGRIVSAMQR